MLKIDIHDIDTINNVLFGDGIIPYTLTDDSYSLCNLAVEYSTNSGLTWTACTANPVAPHEPPNNLASTPTGSIHYFRWNSNADVVFDYVMIRIRATNISSNVAMTPMYTVDNKHVIAEVVTPTTVIDGVTLITYTLYSQAATFADIKCFYSKDDEDTWVEARIAPGGDPPAHITTLGTGYTYTTGWESSEISASVVKFKVVPYSEVVNEIGYEAITDAFFVDNHVEWFYKTIPDTFYALDTDDVIRYYLKILDFERQLNSNIAISLIELLDPMKCPDRYVPLLGASLGVRLDADASIEMQRRQISAAVLWYHKKGTMSAFEAFFLTLGYKVEVREVTSDGSDSDVDFIGGNWYKTARLEVAFFRYSDSAWIEPSEVDELMSWMEEVRPIHDLISEYSWGYDFTEVFSIDDDEVSERVIDFPSLIAGDWLNPPLEVVLFDTWFGDGVTTVFNQIISLPAGIDIKLLSLKVSATSVDTGLAPETDNAPMVGVDDGVGNIAGRNIAPASLINYTTGVISVEFDFPPATYAEVVVMYSLDQRSYAYQPGIPHHIYKKDEASLMYRDRELSTNVQLYDAAPAAEYSATLLRDASYSSVKVVVDNIDSGEIVLYASEKDGYMNNIYNRRVAEYQVTEVLGVTIAAVIYNFNIPAGPPRILPIVPSTPLITIDEMEIECDFEGNLTGSGDIDGVTFEVVSGTINYATGTVDFTLVTAPPANPTINIPIIIQYKRYEFALLGDGVTTLLNIPLHNVPIVPGSVKLMHGGTQLISDNGLGDFVTDAGVTWGSINYATGALVSGAYPAFNLPAASVNNEFYGFTYHFTPLEVVEADSKYYRSVKQVIGIGGGANTLFCAPGDPVNPCIAGFLLQPVPMVPASFYFKCWEQWGRADAAGTITGSAGITGTIDFDTGAYSIQFPILHPLADHEEISAGWDCNYIKVKFNQTIDSVAKFDIQVNSKSVNADNNYDQANSFHYNRNSLAYLNTGSDIDFLYRYGYAEGIGVGDGIATNFTPTLVKYLAAAPIPGTEVQPNSVTIIAWCFNPTRLRAPYEVGNPYQVLAYDDGVGNIVGADDDLAPVWGTINYLTGLMSIDFGLIVPPADGTNIVVHYTDIERSSSALKELGCYHWKTKGSRLSILKAGALYYNE